MKKKTVVMLLSIVLVLGIAVGGTVAYLLDKTDSIVNTFVSGDVDIELEETTDDFTIVPGCDIEKDPVVTVKANSEKCYVFVKVEESANFPNYLEYTIADGWIQLEEGSDVYYRIVNESASDAEFPVLVGNKVTVPSTVTKENLALLTANPTLTVTAYACQYYKSTGSEFTVTEAWAQVND